MTVLFLGQALQLGGVSNDLNEVFLPIDEYQRVLTSFPARESNPCALSDRAGDESLDSRWIIRFVEMFFVRARSPVRTGDPTYR